MAEIDLNNPVVLVNGGGIELTYVRWYPDLWAAERNHVLMTVTSNGISIHTQYLEGIPTEWLDKAKAIRELLRSSPFADMSQEATHRPHGLSNGPLMPVGSGTDG